MKRKEIESLRKHTLNLYEGDFDRLQMLYPNTGAAIIIRRLVRNHLTKIELLATPNMPTLDDVMDLPNEAEAKA